MRKALTVLLLLVVVLGAAFAGDPTPSPVSGKGNTVTLISIIGRKLPTFNLTATAGDVTVETNGGDNAKAFTDGERYVSDVLTLTGDIATRDITQTFELFSAAKANYFGGFEFTILAEPFETVRAEGSSYKTKGDILYRYESSEIPATESNITVAADQGRLLAMFNGAQVGQDIKLGQIVVTWPQDPSAIAGEYNTNVMMTVKTN